MKLPREGTRARALVDLLIQNSKAGVHSNWSHLKHAYDDHPPSYNHAEFGPRYHSSMNVSRLLRKYATRVERGWYVFKDSQKKQEPRLFKIGDRVELYRITPGTTITSRTNPETGKPFQVGDQATVVEVTYRAEDLGCDDYKESKQWLAFKGMNAFGGGWASQNWRLVEEAGPKNDKGSPEIRDMAWGSTCDRSDPERCVLQEHFHGLNPTQLESHTFELAVMEDRFRDAEAEADRWQTRARHLEFKLSEWRDAVVHASSLLSNIQNSTPYTLVENINDLDAQLTGLNGDIEEAM